MQEDTDNRLLQDTDISLLLEEINRLKQENTELKVSLSDYQNREAALQRARHERDAILDQVRETILYVDPELKILYVNKISSEMKDMLPVQMVGRYCYEVYQGRNEPCPNCTIRKVIETCQPQIAEAVFPDGILRLSRAYPIQDGDGNLLGVFEMGLDLTERKTIEEELRKSKDKLQLILESSPDAIIVVDLDGAIVECNQACLNIYRGSRDDLIGKNVYSFIVAKDLPRTHEIAREAIHHPVLNIELELKNREGHLFAAEMSTSVIKDVDGNPMFFVIIGRDITGRKQFEQEMARLDRLNLMGEIAAGIAHEIRNPLTVVRGYLQIMQLKEEFASNKKRFDTMIEELDRANTIITEFLTLARNAPTELKKQSINRIVTNLLPLIQADAAKNHVAVSMDLGDVPDLNLDEKEIRQLVLNLVRNGIEAMSKHGELTIKTRRKRDRVVLTIKDRGMGIPPEVLKKLGTPFLTTKEKGTGLGLPICYRIAESHNAKIEIKTGKKGTTFMVSFQVPSLQDEVNDI
jgi:two-component system, sporulation sensor kinase E